MTDITPMDGTLQRQHILRKIHLDVIWRALRGYYVIWPSGGGAVTQRAADANMSVDVAAVNFVFNGTYAQIATDPTNVAIDAADPANARIDVIYISDSTTISVAKGTAASVVPVGESTWQKWETPYPVDMYGTDGVILAEVRVAAGATSITNADIRMLGLPVIF